MPYIYETHCHCALCSACAKSTPEEMILAYHRAGFAGLVLTDHFIYGNTAVPRDLPWAERMGRYYDAFLRAKAQGDALDFDVIFGLEHAYGDGKEVLLYGIDLPFLLANPDIPDLTLDELVRRVHAVGGIAVQAHPYRNRSYVNMAVGPRADIVDGIEIYNTCNLPGEDRQALALAETGAYIRTCGGDIHWDDDPRLGKAGIVLPYRVHDAAELVTALKRGDHQYLVNGIQLPEIQETDLP